MSQTPQRVETPARSPGLGGRRPVPAPPVPHGDGGVARPQSAGPPPDYRDGPAPAPGLAPPDTAPRPALETPGTTGYWPLRSDTSPQGPSPGGAPGPAALRGR